VIPIRQKSTNNLSRRRERQKNRKAGAGPAFDIPPRTWPFWLSGIYGKQTTEIHLSRHARFMNVAAQHKT
jgi:hypothetical protein